MTTTKEDRELDAWIAEHVMGWKDVREFKGQQMGFKAIPGTTKEECEFVPCYCIDPALALDLLAKCAEKCGVEIFNNGHGFRVGRIGTGNCYGDAPTIPLAIAKFAHALFSKKAQGGE